MLTRKRTETRMRKTPKPISSCRLLMVCAIREPSSVTHFFASAFTGKLQKVRLTTVILNASTDIPLPVGGAERTFSGNASDWSFCDPSQPAPS